jgi:hypothetical protein
MDIGILLVFVIVGLKFVLGGGGIRIAVRGEPFYQPARLTQTLSHPNIHCLSVLPGI